PASYKSRKSFVTGSRTRRKGKPSRGVSPISRRITDHNTQITTTNIGAVHTSTAILIARECRGVATATPTTTNRPTTSQTKHNRSAEFSSTLQRDLTTHPAETTSHHDVAGTGETRHDAPRSKTTALPRAAQQA